MFKYLLILLLTLPFIDLYVLIQLTSMIGFLQTLLIVLVTGVIGAEIIRREGRNVFRKLHTSVTGKEISRNLLELILLVIGGIMLLSPGLVTDLLGLVMVLRPTRERIMLKLAEKLGENSDIHVESYHF